MKTVIRHGVFETNSSSTHSIAIDTRDYEPIHVPLDNGVLKASCGEFGWEQEVYTDFYTKLSYVLTWAMRNFDENTSESEYRESDEFIKIEDVLREKIEGFERLEVESLRDYYPFGYIDHQSTDDGAGGVPAEAMDNLVDFLFNPKSILVTDNDNH